MNKLSPIVSEFDTVEEAEAYDVWFRAKVEESLADPRPSIPHDQVMAELRALIEQRSQSKDADLLATGCKPELARNLRLYCRS